MESGHENLENPVTSVIKETIYVAVGIDVKDCKSTLLWALHNNGGKKICIIHVHRPAQRIPSNCKSQNLRKDPHTKSLYYIYIKHGSFDRNSVFDVVKTDLL